MLLGRAPGCARGRCGRLNARGDEGEDALSVAKSDEGVLIVFVVQESPRIGSTKRFVFEFSGSMVCVCCVWLRLRLREKIR
jgi:hypothetical protein